MIYSNYSWEQRKFSELVEIERGGSPRPIDDYITDDPYGLNWVKIGDAPILGNYITKTAEKIRYEGLSKTREVFPGDLILSNSMSFGKPYIMGIKGCIHDGWLLIRNKKNFFDLIYLCHLLGTPYMLSKYKSLAAGSTVNNLNKELVSNTIVCFPNLDEQSKMGQCLEAVDTLITLHQRKQKVSILHRRKKSVHFYYSWEQRKLKDESNYIIAGGDVDKSKLKESGSYPVIANALTNDGIVGYYTSEFRIDAPAVTVTGRGEVGHAVARKCNFTPIVRLLSIKTSHDVDFLANNINLKGFVVESTGVPQLTVPKLEDLLLYFPKQISEEMHIGNMFVKINELITLHQRKQANLILKTISKNSHFLTKSELEK